MMTKEQALKMLMDRDAVLEGHFSADIGAALR